MTEDTTPERIPFEEHPLYPLYKAGRQQWNLFMKEYLNEDKITEVGERNPTMKDDFESASALTTEQKNLFNQYMSRNPTEPKKKIRFIFGTLDFENYDFGNDVNFRYHFFPNFVSFMNARFLGQVNFESAQFSDWTNFQSAQFSQKAFFQSTQFSGQADFKSAKFSFPADFQSTRFSDVAYFQSTQFSDMAYFKSTEFLGEADFQSAEFSSWAYFQNAQFSRQADFDQTTFKSKIDFSNATFKAATDLTGASFERYVPEFYEATLHQNTIFDNTIWPNSSNIQDEQILSSNQSAYNCLVLEMNKQLRHEQELYFFAKELEIKRHIHWHRNFLTWFLNFLYDLASGYGRSVKRPIFLILSSFIVILSVNFYTYNDKLILDESAREAVLRYTFLDFLPGGPLLQQRAVAGLFEATDPCPPHLFCPPPLWLDIVNSFASVVILAGFFLLGLGLRNRFRIR